MKPGDLIASKYRLQRVLGLGGMGKGWEAVNEGTGRSFAIKVMHSLPPEFRTRLLREARAGGTLNHKNIAPIYDVGETESGDPFLVMELLSGENLADRLKRDGPLPPPKVVELGLAIAAALRAAHAKGIIHRDLKPANIFLHQGPDGEAEVLKVLDFGASKHLQDPTGTTTVGLVGSPAYMSPEQARAESNLDARSDLWSLGVVLFEMLTGRRPFPATTTYAVIAEIISGPIPSVAEAVPGLPATLGHVVDGCLQREVDARIGSADDVIRLLQASLDVVSASDADVTRRREPSVSSSQPRAPLAPSSQPGVPFAPSSQPGVPFAPPSHPGVPAPSPSQPRVPSGEWAPALTSLPTHTELILAPKPAPTAPSPSAPSIATPTSTPTPTPLATPTAPLGLVAPSDSSPSRGLAIGVAALGAVTAAVLSAVVWTMVFRRPAEAASEPPARTSIAIAPVSAAPPPPPATTTTTTTTTTTEAEPAAEAASGAPVASASAAPAATPPLGKDEALLVVDAPDGTAVSLDGAPMGTTPRAPIIVPAGAHRVVFKHATLGERSAMIQTLAGETSLAATQFGKDTGTARASQRRVSKERTVVMP